MVVPEHDETKGSDGGSSHVIADVGDGDVKKLSDSFVVGSASVGKGDGEHATVSEEGILAKRTFV
jgi:hypothetical protein